MKIYIVDYPQLSLQAAMQWLKDEQITQPKEDGMGYYFLPGQLGKIMGKYLLSQGWKFHVTEEE